MRPEIITEAVSGDNGSVTAFKYMQGNIILSADIAIIPESDDFTCTAEESFTQRISVDVKLMIADTFYDEYSYSMDIAGLPEWLKASGELASSDNLIPIDADGHAEYHHVFTLSGTPARSSDIAVTLTATVMISGDIPVLTAYASRDVNISVKPVPAPELDTDSITITAEAGKEIEPAVITALKGKNIAWSFSGDLPAGLSGSLEGDKYTISGTPGLSAFGTYRYYVSAANTGGTAKAYVDISVVRPEIITEAVSGGNGSVTAFKYRQGNIILSADIAIIPDSLDIAVIAGETLSHTVSVDVRLMIADTFYDEYSYSMDIAGLPEWLKASGELASSDNLIPIDADGHAEYHHVFTLSGTPARSSDIAVTLTATVMISGDIPVLTAYASRDVNISVKPVPAPVTESESSTDIEPEPDITTDIETKPAPEPKQDIAPEPVKETENQTVEDDIPASSYVLSETSLQAIEQMTETERQSITKIEISGSIQDLSLLNLLTNLQEVDLKQAVSLETVDLSGNTSIKSADISGNTTVKSINLAGSNIETFDAKGCASLESIDISGCANLKELDITGTDISSLNAEDCAKLEVLSAASCGLTSINLKGCISLETLTLDGNSLPKFDAQIFSRLRELSCSGQMIEGWTVGRRFNLGQYLDSVSVSAADEGVSSASGNIGAVRAYDEDGNEITAEYDAETGVAVFGSVPYKMSYEYATGFNDAVMDVSVFTDGTDTEDESSGSGPNSPNGGCDTGFASVIVLAVMAFFRKR